MGEQRTNRYRSDKEKIDALVRLAANGGNYSQTSRETGIPISTIRLWDLSQDQQVFAADCKAQKEALGRGFRELAFHCLGLLPEKLETAPAQVVANVLGISTEKALLLEGSPTAITDHRSRGAVNALRDINSLLGRPSGPEEADPVRQPAPSTDNA